MNIKKITLDANGCPTLLGQIPSPPKQLYCLGKPLEGLENKPTIVIIGSRNVSPYGRHVTEELASGLARNGLVIVSGLAMGVDGIAHHATIEAKTEEEHAIIILLKKGIADGYELLARSELKPAVFNQTLTMMEITGKVKPGGSGTWLLL